jgi:SAM-dependent MidA family methyltransferase
MTDPSETIRRAIDDHGPISFSEFMELALYGPGGFYEHPPVGEAGHFVTSPHVHPVFARMLARALRGMWDLLGRPSPFHVVEVGAGDGTLARDLQDLLAGTGCKYVAVDRSPGARARLRELPVTVTASLEAAGHSHTGCVLANELLDNLPFRWLRGTPRGPVEIRVGLQRDRFAAVEVPWDRSLEWDEEIPAPTLEPGGEAALPIGALHFLDRLAHFLGSGYVLLIDYAASEAAGPVHGYRGHRVVEDVLAAPGRSDITAGVDLATVIHRAGRLGLRAYRPVTQRSALLALGVAEWLEDERRRQVAFLDRGAGREAVLAWSGRHRASGLVDPAALGRLRWLLIATAGQPWPSWVEDAAERDQWEGISGPVEPNGLTGGEHRPAPEPPIEEET